MKKKLDRREAVRERKALSAAHLERSIEKELIERLKSKSYGDAPLNVNESVWQAILDREKGEKERELNADDLELEADETDEEDEEELEEEMEDFGDAEFVSDFSDESDDEDDGVSDDSVRFPSLISGMRALIPWQMATDEESSDASDSDDADTKLGKRRAKARPSRKRVEKKPRKGPRVEVEYEQEMERVPAKSSVAADW